MPSVSSVKCERRKLATEFGRGPHLHVLSMCHCNEPVHGSEQQGAGRRKRQHSPSVGTALYVIHPLLECEVMEESAQAEVDEDGVVVWWHSGISIDPRWRRGQTRNKTHRQGVHTDTPSSTESRSTPSDDMARREMFLRFSKGSVCDR